MNFLGAVSVHLHMLNEQSRKYFKRAFMFSGTAFVPTVVQQNWNHVQQIQDCLQIIELNDLIENLKIENTTVLARCYPYTFPADLNLNWAPTIESVGTTGAFLTQTPEKIYNSGNAPSMDVVFSFNSQVLYHKPVK